MQDTNLKNYKSLLKGHQPTELVSLFTLIDQTKSSIIHMRIIFTDNRNKIILSDDYYKVSSDNFDIAFMNQKLFITSTLDAFISTLLRKLITMHVYLNINLIFRLKDILIY